jgi:putative oxidoreductase
MGFLAPYAEYIYAAFRIMTGLLFAQHGFQKLLGWFGGVQGEMPAPLLYTAGAIELFGGLLVAIGLAAGIAAFIASGMMAVAYFMVHLFNAQFNPTGSWFPIENGGEAAVQYCFAFLFIAAKGSGTWSIDAARGAK